LFACEIKEDREESTWFAKSTKCSILEWTIYFKNRIIIFPFRNR
jgi:hypothetical protein